MPEYLSESILDQLNNDLYNKNLTQGTRAATDWMAKKMKSMTVDRNKLMRDNERLTPQMFVGSMHFFFYDPKFKSTLPYYDRFPLLVPLDLDKEHFTGLNLHYISPRERTVFLRELVGYTSNTKYDETTRFRLTYNLLKNVSSMDQYRPCYKKYLWSHVRSQFLKVDAFEWYIAVMLPVAHFAKKTENQVWRESRTIRKRRIQFG